MPIGTSTAAGPIRLAVGLNGEARLLLPLAAQDRPSGIDAGDALAVSVSSFEQNGRVHRFLDLMCLLVELEPVFGEVVDEIVTRVSNGAGCIEATRTTVNDFRALLAAKASEQIERSRVASLIAELIVLNKLLDLSVSAWRVWKGPVGDRHDFRAADTSLEVKATLRAGPEVITVNGLTQLEPPSGGKLYLAYFVLEPVAGGLLTVAGLGERALAKADDPAGLRHLLVGVGCPDVRADAWNRDALRIEAESLYRVEGDFPRIVPSVFPDGRAPAGISGVTYQADLSVARAYKCQADELEDLLRILAR